MAPADLRRAARCAAAGDDTRGGRADDDAERNLGRRRSPARFGPEDRPRLAQSRQGYNRTGRRRRRGRVAGASGCAGTLPVAAEIDRRSAAQGQADHAMHLLAVAKAPGVLPPGRLLGVAEEIRTGDVMVVPELAAAQARDVGFRAIGAGAVDAVALLVIDPPHREPGVQLVPGRALIGMQ